jgi:glutathione S-transferase
MRLIIGNKNYSSWSLRPWLLLKHTQIPFEEERLSFNAPDFAARVAQHSPAGRVPVLIDGDLVIWDSLAIVEYLAERFPDRQIWPAERRARARARSLCAEMHAGFAPMRSSLTMNLELRAPMPLLTLPVRRDVERIIRMWTDARSEFGADGPFLFGRFSAADAYFAPVTTRFTTYSIGLPEVAARYVATIEALPAMREWVAAALEEKDFVAHDEPYRASRGG